ncbi:DUF7144 family membrane protein [Pseudosporangium ferrugineum]|uniref:DUF7144 domain-containing protein n=1 Tax=Pseudosporangium ferrugineum TaxID=439699 RepID=A0A2T0SBQ1_9ACTN|nr:hypothetical protein [Pseudosporangium ferrugineum]PRY30832.1 hypothetical protein CLV70_104384 [Pseudosporangium ferrugineum]
MPDPETVPGAAYAGVTRSEATAWAGWALLGAIMIFMLGVVHVSTGLLALLRPEALAGGRADLLLPVGLTAVAWVHTAIGTVAAVTGLGLLRGLVWARVTTVLLAVVAALVNFVFLDVYPMWSVTAIAMTVVVTYAVSVHGAEVAGAYGDS